MIKRSMVIGLLSAGVVAVPGMALASAQVNSTPIIPVSTPATVSTTAAQADQAALAAVGGGTVTSTSTDTYQGASVYDIHVLFNSVVYDVKVLQSNDSVVLKKVSSESSTPAATTQSAPAESQPPEGSSSSSQTTSGSTTQSAPAESQPPEGSSSSSQTTSGSTNPVVSTSGITYGVKLTAVPSTFQSFVAQALTQNHGTLKWVKFTAKTGGETQANIKISLSQGGTVKVIDLISTTGQLISQTVNS